MQRSPLIAIAGVTGSGKSNLAMEVARRYNGEIICADSRTVYKGMDIGTAKPSKADQAEVPHHLIDIVEPGQPFSAAQFKELAQKAIKDIHQRGRVPILVGGTGLYIDAVVFDYQFGDKADTGYRQLLQELSIEELQELCRQKNIEIPQNNQNKRHLIRAIELGGLQIQDKTMRPDTLVVAIDVPKDELIKRLTIRADIMVKNGVLAEVESLGDHYGWESEAMTGNIYRIMKKVVEKTSNLHDALAEFVRSDMQLAKRQKTWLKRHDHILWGNPKELMASINAFLRSPLS